MKKLIFAIALAVGFVACGQADQDQYKALGPQPVYGESNGLFYDSTNDYLSMFVNDVEVAYITAAGNWVVDGTVGTQTLDPADDAATCFGTGDDFCIEFNAANAAPDCAYIGVGTESNQLVIGEVADTTGAAAADLAIAQQTNPTLIVHSADATDALDYVSLAMDQTNCLLDCGQGSISINDPITSSANAADVLTCTGAAPTITIKDNEAAALVIKSSGAAALMSFDTRTGAEEVNIVGDTATSVFRVDTGFATFDEKAVMTLGISSPVTAADAITLTGAAPTITLKDNEAAALVIKSSGAAALMSFDTRTGAEEVNIVGDTATSVFRVDTGFATFDEQAVMTLGISSSVTAADVLTCTGAAPTITLKDDEAAALAIKSSGTETTFISIDTQTGAEKFALKGAAAGVTTFHLDQGTMLVDETAAFTGGFTAGAPAVLHQVIRFCGNGPAGGVETFLSPVPFDDTEADFISGGAGCDAEDNTTVGTADEPWPLLPDAAFKPVAMVCTAICTGATAANDVIVFRMMDDTAAVTGMTCSTTALGGDATAAQCTVTDTSPATVAAGSAIAIGVDDTNDNCADAGDDFSCLVYVTF